jgi:hypothetical protein
MFKAGFAQVNVNIDEAGGDYAAGGVENLRATGIDVRSQLADYSILDRNIRCLIEIRGRVNHSAILDNESTHWASTLSKTAMRTAMPFST